MRAVLVTRELRQMATAPTRAAPTTSVALADATGEADPRCAACQHFWTTHDDIAARFCAATMVSGTTRGCVCVPDETTATAT